MGNFFSQSGGGDDRTMFYKQLGKYEKYLGKSTNEEAKEMMQEELQRMRDRLDDAKENNKDLVEAMIEVFSMLQENRVPMGKAMYPGPGEDWKEFVAPYL